MIQKSQVYFKKSYRFKIYIQIQEHLLQDFESVSDQFMILDIKGLRIFVKKFLWYLLLFFTISTFISTSISIYLHLCTATS